VEEQEILIKDILENAGEDDNYERDDSDDDVIVSAKRGGKKKLKKSTKQKKQESSSETSVFEISPKVNEIAAVDSSTLITPASPPIVRIKTSCSDEGLLESLTKPKKDINCNLTIDRPRPVSISTPEQVMNRSSPSLDQEIFSTPVEVKKEMHAEKKQQLPGCLVGSAKSHVGSPEVKVSITHVNTIPPLNIQSLPEVTISHSASHHPPRVPSSQATPSGPLSSQAKVSRPVNPAQGLARKSPALSPRPIFRPGASMMMRPVRPVPFGAPNPIGPRPRPPPYHVTGPRLASVRSLAPVRHASARFQFLSSQSNPPVVELDTSPERTVSQSPLFPPSSEQRCSSNPPSISIVDKLSYIGVSVAQKQAPPALHSNNNQHGFKLPPGISVTRSTPSREGPSLTLPKLATALLRLGNTGGRRRLVQFALTEEQVTAFSDLGVEEV